MKTLIKLDCGIHYGEAGRKCGKCGSGITARDIANRRNAGLVAAVRPVGSFEFDATTINDFGVRRPLSRAVRVF